MECSPLEMRGNKARLRNGGFRNGRFRNGKDKHEFPFVSCLLQGNVTYLCEEGCLLCLYLIAMVTSFVFLWPGIFFYSCLYLFPPLHRFPAVEISSLLFSF